MGDVRYSLRESEVASRLAAIGADVVLRRIAIEHGTTPDDILSKRRSFSIERARMRFIFVLYGTLGLSRVELATLLGRDHSSIGRTIQIEERRAEWRLGL
jgi:chromosomal replication initiation ATPase DnaA